MVRVIEDGVAWEYSIVARPSYAGTTVDARAEEEEALLVARRRVWL